MKSPLFQSRKARGIAPHRIDGDDEKKGLYTVWVIPDLYPITSGIHPQQYKDLQCSEESWGYIEFLPNSNREFIEELLMSSREFRQTHTASSGFATDFQYLPHTPFPLWTRHLRCPDFPDFERWLPSLNTKQIEGGFAFVDTHSFWAIYGQHVPEFGVTFLCIHTHHLSPSPAFSQAMLDLASDHGLCLIDWGKLCIVPTQSVPELKSWMSEYT